MSEIKKIEVENGGNWIGVIEDSVITGVPSTTNRAGFRDYIAYKHAGMLISKTIVNKGYSTQDLTPEQEADFEAEQSKFATFVARHESTRVAKDFLEGLSLS